MTLRWHQLIELGAVALVLGFTLWVLVVQPVALIGSMPKPRFLGLQMRVVRAWVRALVPLTAAVLAMALLRVGASAAVLPAAAALLGAALAAGWAVPRALRAGGAAVREGDDDLSAEGFLSEGGGDKTRVWHRVVLACVALVLGGVALDGRDVLAHAPPARCDDCAHRREGHERPAASSPSRTPAPQVTARAVYAFEREVAAMVAAGGEGDTAPLRGAWRNIFTSCTMQGEAHERLHEFLAPMMPGVSQLDAVTGAARLPTLRAMLGQVARFDDRFAVTP